MIKLGDGVKIIEGWYAGYRGKVTEIETKYVPNKKLTTFTLQIPFIGRGIYTRDQFLTDKEILANPQTELEQVQADYSELRERHIALASEFSELVQESYKTEAHWQGQVITAAEIHNDLLKKYSDPKFLLKKLNEILNEKSNKKD